MPWTEAPFPLPRIALDVSAIHTTNPDWDSGKLFFTAGGLDVYEPSHSPEDCRVIASVQGTLDGHLQASFPDGNTYLLRNIDFLEALCRALNIHPEIVEAIVKQRQEAINVW